MFIAKLNGFEGDVGLYALVIGGSIFLGVPIPPKNVPNASLGALADMIRLYFMAISYSIPVFSPNSQY